MAKSFKTFLKHAGADFNNQSVNHPVVRASTLIFRSIDEIRKMQNKAKDKRAHEREHEHEDEDEDDNEDEDEREQMHDDDVT